MLYEPHPVSSSGVVYTIVAFTFYPPLSCRSFGALLLASDAGDVYYEALFAALFAFLPYLPPGKSDDFRLVFLKPEFMLFPCDSAWLHPGAHDFGPPFRPTSTVLASVMFQRFSPFSPHADP